MKLLKIFNHPGSCPLCDSSLFVHINKRSDLHFNDQYLSIEHKISKFNTNAFSGEYHYQIIIDTNNKFEVEVFKNGNQLQQVPAGVIYNIISGNQNKSNVVYLVCDKCKKYHFQFSSFNFDFDNHNIKDLCPKREMLTFDYQQIQHQLLIDKKLEVYNNYTDKTTTIIVIDSIEKENMNSSSIEIPLLPHNNSMVKYLDRIQKCILLH